MPARAQVRQVLGVYANQLKSQPVIRVQTKTVTGIALCQFIANLLTLNSMPQSRA